MDNIKQISTGNVDLLLVKVPKDARKFSILHYKGIPVLEYLCVRGEEIELPPGNWTPLGLSTELTEEQCRPLFKHKDGYGLSFELPAPNHRAAYFTAIGAFASLMQANGCYSVNPYKDGKPSIINSDVWYSEEQYQQAEANTGTYLILKAI